MGKQQLLFDPGTDTWVDRVWRTVAADTHRMALSILAEMGRAALARRPRETEPREGRSHES